jgi:hypothetical protein
VLDCCKGNVYALQALVKNYILMDMNKVILNSVARAKKKKGLIASAVHEMRIVKIVYSYYCEQ